MEMCKMAQIGRAECEGCGRLCPGIVPPGNLCAPAPSSARLARGRLLTVSAIAEFQWPRCGARKPQATKRKLTLSAKFGLQWIQFGDYLLGYSGYSLVFICWVTVDTV